MGGSFNQSAGTPPAVSNADPDLMEGSNHASLVS